MNHLFALKLSLILFVAIPHPAVPSALLGTWKVGRAFDTPGATDLTNELDVQIKKLHFEITADAINVCGKHVPIESTTLSILTNSDFARRYRMWPKEIGLNGTKITEFEINSSEDSKACGDFSDPGTHIFFDEQGHVAMEIDNAYYLLRQAK